MMTILDKMLIQDAVYWPPASPALDDYGRPVSATPEAIRCRWENTAKEYIDPQGTTRVSSVRVLTQEDLAIGGFLMLGSVDDVTIDEGDPVASQPGAYAIQQIARTPNLDGRYMLKVVWL